MTVEKVFFDDTLMSVSDLDNDEPIETSKELIMTALALNNDALMDNEGNVLGDPTETALYNFAKTNGFHKEDLEKIYPRISEIPFDSERKCMTTFHKWKEGYISFTKGATDNLIEKSINVRTTGGIRNLNVEALKSINELMAGQGLRVLCIAYRLWDTIPDGFTPENVETGLTILGLTGMMDPPREEAKEAVAMCKTAGIVPVMITGDHPITAMTIAKRLGIMENNHHAVITGRELDGLTLEEFEKQVEDIRVYARVAPEQKLKIVRALQDKGHFVAMTGDGVNDAPALKRADIGIAMGITGTDVSKEAAHMILLDDNFATIVKAVKEGRKIYDNIRKFIKYLLTTNSGEIWTLFLAPIFGLPIPLLPIHILWINLVTDGLPALALSVEPEEEDVMNRPPRDPKESIFAHGLGIHAIWVGLLMGGIVLLTQAFSIKTGNSHWQTMVFTVLCLTQLGHVLAIRSEKSSLFKMGLFSNKYLLGAVVLTFILQMATIYIPSLNPIFKTVPLNLKELILAIVLSSIVFFAVEIEKFIKRRMR